MTVTITLTRAEATELRDFLTGSGKLTYTSDGIDLFHVVQKLNNELSSRKRGSVRDDVIAEVVAALRAEADRAGGHPEGPPWHATADYIERKFGPQS